MKNEKIVLITACGNKKEKGPAPAWKLYKSSRIRHLYKKSKELGIPLYILSAKYGLVFAEEVIEPYDMIMEEKRCKELIEQIKLVISKYNAIIFFKGGSRKVYKNCLEKVVNELNKKLVVFGYGNMGDIGKLEDIVNALSKRSW